MSTDRSTTLTFGVLGLVLALAIAATVYVTYTKKPVDDTPNLAEAALVRPEGDRQYTDLNGNTVSLGSYIDSVLVVNSWASWCPDCEANLRIMAEIQSEYGSAGVKVLAINRAENTTIAQRYIQKTIGLDALTLVLDPDDAYFKTIGGYTMPETVVYNQAGEVIYHKHGIITRPELEQYIAAALGTDAQQ